MNEQEFKEHIWDYSQISSFQTCRKKFYYEHIRHLRPKKKGNALVFGHAIHQALDCYYQDGLKPALDVFSNNFEDIEGDELRTKANGIKLLEWYAKKYEHEPFKPVGKPEKGFIFYIGDIIFGGRIDLPVEWDGNLWIMEHKTSTRLTASYFDQYELDKQVTGYILAAESYFSDKKVMGCILNVLEPWKDLIRPTAKSKQPEDHYLRKPITRSTEIKERFKLNVQRIVRDIGWCLENDEWMEAEKKEVCQYYGRPCPYLQLCQYGENPRVLENEYVIEKWEPFAQEGEVE